MSLTLVIEPKFLMEQAKGFSETAKWVTELFVRIREATSRGPRGRLVVGWSPGDLSVPRRGLGGRRLARQGLRVRGVGR